MRRLFAAAWLAWMLLSGGFPHRGASLLDTIGMAALTIVMLLWLGGPLDSPQPNPEESA